MDKIKVMVVDDQIDLANEIGNILKTDDTLEVVGVAADGFDTLQKMKTSLPDVVLLDFSIRRNVFCRVGNSFCDFRR